MNFRNLLVWLLTKSKTGCSDFAGKATIIKDFAKDGVSVQYFNNNVIWKKRNYYISLLKLLVDPSLRNMPQWVNFQTTFACNLRCPQCQTHGTPRLREIYNRKAMNMPAELLEKAAKETLPWVNTYSLSLNGEPLLTPNADDIISRFYSLFNAKLDLTTNGMLLTPAMLDRILPFLDRVGFSVDGAKKDTFEKNRLGAKYETFVTNVKITTRIFEIAAIKDIEVSLTYVVMGNNIRELPEVVKLADFLGVKIIYGYFLVVFSENNMAHEDVNLYKALYNVYLEKALELADQCKIILSFPMPFKDVDRNAIEAEKRLIEEPMYVEKKIRQLVDMDQIEREANIIASNITSRRSNIAEIHVDFTKACTWKTDYLGELLALYKDKLNSLTDNPNDHIKYCDFIHRRIYVGYNGDVSPCCVVGRPILGNANDRTIADIWNGEKYNDFRTKFRSSEPYECCSGCVFLQNLPIKDFLQQLSSLEKKQIY